MAMNRARIARPIGLTDGGMFQVVVEYFDAAAPAVVLWSETFQMPSNATTTDLRDKVIERGQALRPHLDAVAAAQAAVPQGTTITIP
jgi:hypothetical protein